MDQPTFRIEVPEHERGNIRCDRRDRDRFNGFCRKHGYQQHQFLKILLDRYESTSPSQEALVD